MINPSQADQLIQNHLRLLSVKETPLEQACGRVLREDLSAVRDEPAYSRSAMDGIAVDTRACRSGRKSFLIRGTARAGEPVKVLESAEHCLKIMTGALIPVNADSVIPVEEISITNDLARLDPRALAESGRFIRPKGSYVRKGATVLRQGCRLGAARIAIAAGLGKALVRVSAEPRIAVIETGDELVEIRGTPQDHQIYRANGYGIAAALTLNGFPGSRCFHWKDDPGQMRNDLRKILQDFDLVITSGAVSMGDFDDLPRIFEELGVQRVFHQVCQRPGKPLWFGITHKGTALFGLPGNPVSTLICMARYVLPAVRSMSGESPCQDRYALLAGPVEPLERMTLFIPVRLRSEKSGNLLADPCPARNSGDIFSLKNADGFAEIPPQPDAEGAAAGRPVRIVPWN